MQTTSIYVPSTDRTLTTIEPEASVTKMLQSILDNGGGQYDGAITCGIHSGYPTCCVLFYVMRYSQFAIEPWPEWKQDAYIGKMREEGLRPRGYIPCPVCLKTKIAHGVRPRRCRCGSPPRKRRQK